MIYFFINKYLEKNSLTSGYCARYSLINSWESGWMSSQTFSPEERNLNTQNKYI